MTAPPVPPADWLAALEAEFAGLAPGTLGLPGVELGPRTDHPPEAMAGAYLPVVGEWGSVQLALLSSAPGCGAIARGLLGMGPTDELAQPEVADAVCEVVNILVGAVKGKLRERGPMQMGLPTFFNGPVQPTDRLGVAARELRVGDVSAALVVVHPRS